MATSCDRRIRCAIITVLRRRRLLALCGALPLVIAATALLVGAQFLGLGDGGGAALV
jgi:hypothetical protein